MNDFAAFLDVVAKVAAVIATIGGGILGTKLWQWRAQLRNLNAQSSAAEAGAASGKADATETFVQTALLLANPALVGAIGSRLTVLEKWAEEEKGWQDHVMSEARANGWTLPAPPRFPRPSSTAAGGL